MSFGVTATANRWPDSHLPPRPTVLIGFVLLTTIIAAASYSDATNATPIGVPQLVDATGQSYYANAHPYLEEPLAQLVQRIPELKALQPSPDQQALPMILSKTGERVDDFFRNVVDILGHEEITQERLNAKGAVKTSQHVQYSYLILLHRDESPQRVEEYRADSTGNRAEQSGVDKNYAVTSGFALLSIHFSPGNRSDSTFRYLGDEAIGARNAYVVAFAQRPGRAMPLAFLNGDWGTVPILLQGIAWVDKNTYQIIKIRTDLLAPRTDFGVDQQTTEVAFTEVQLPDLATSLSLPSEVTVYSVFHGSIFRNRHTYSDYKRFRVSVKIGPQ
jgi:hypothetical protein